jgi:hypothetical protein
LLIVVLWEEEELGRPPVLPSTQIWSTVLVYIWEESLYVKREGTRVFLKCCVWFLILFWPWKWSGSYVFGRSGNPPYSHGAAGLTWRVSFGVLIPVVLYFLYYRVYVLKEIKTLDKVKKQNAVAGASYLRSVTIHQHSGRRGACEKAAG